jgi:hypothetical protein
MAFSPTNLGSQYMMNGRIHNNDEGRWQHPELKDRNKGGKFGIRDWDQEFKMINVVVFGTSTRKLCMIALPS